ncbi:hypothetical protein AKJ09_00574 [Labilithrix luteola]|uniref:Uncharacterized protein n=1 Tax=Labilithrix luteola TaxID=1391654 RepID=A0A0K1PK55_9BACT|nr:hypothetical protein [Labilithrix luteola]AKU93910.1 hypothetical protein AKJ09_00574 [Labilithrix luteola]
MRARGVSPLVVDDPRTDFRPTPWGPFVASIETPAMGVVVDALCGPDRARCKATCGERKEARSFAACAIDALYGDDSESWTLARELFDEHGTLPGTGAVHVIDAGYLGVMNTRAALPKGAYRHHLQWLVKGLRTIESVIAAVATTSSEPVLFRTRPHAVMFYKTDVPSYPSAYAMENVVGYNLEGPLHESEHKVMATLFHEIFHLNDAGHGDWSDRALSPLFSAILETCADDDACLEPYAPDDTKVPGGTYYPFDPRTAAVREYAAEIGERWFVEHRAIVERGEQPEQAFKCATSLNADAWSQVVGEFFGGVDLVAECPTPAPSSEES